MLLNYVNMCSLFYVIELQLLVKTVITTLTLNFGLFSFDQSVLYKSSCMINV